MTGRERFVASLNRLREDRMPATAKKWAVFNLGYRRLLCRQAGFVAELAEKPLGELSPAQRRTLFDANRKVMELAQQANLVLLAAVTVER